MCGILGILANKGPISNLLYDGLLVLQHRGQDAAGIVVCEDNKLHLRKDNGRRAFDYRRMEEAGFDYKTIGLG